VRTFSALSAGFNLAVLICSVAYGLGAGSVALHAGGLLFWLMYWADLVITARRTG
jgi:hypothetical protein